MFLIEKCYNTTSIVCRTGRGRALRPAVAIQSTIQHRTAPLFFFFFVVLVRCAVPVYCSGAISTPGLADRLLGRLISYSQGELLDGIADHQPPEYLRLFEKLALEVDVSPLEQAAGRHGGWSR